MLEVVVGQFQGDLKMTSEGKYQQSILLNDWLLVDSDIQMTLGPQLAAAG